MICKKFWKTIVNILLLRL